MASEFADIDGTKAVYLVADSPIEVFQAAAQWAAEHDGGFSIVAVAWSDDPQSPQRPFGLQIYYEPTQEDQ